jgi:Fic family protein
LVRTKNDLGQWIKFFLTGVIQTSDMAVTTLKKIVGLKLSIEGQRMSALGNRAGQGKTLLHALFSRPIVTIKDVQAMTGLTPRAANNLVKAFIAQGILEETTGFQRNRVFMFQEYMKLFS